jgi:integrase
MPVLTNRHPTYRKHKASGQAIVTLGGRDFYLGPYGTRSSHVEYDRLIQEWLSRGKQAPGPAADLTVVELIAAFMDHAETYYRRPDGTLGSEFDNFRCALRPLNRLYGEVAAAQFGPLALKAVRQEMTDLGWCRKNINRQIGRIKHLFKWGLENELIPASLHHALSAVAGLRAGRSGARESRPVKPVPVERITALRPYLSRQVAAMIDLQLLTGMRPGEVISMRGADVETPQDGVWTYCPATHKTQYLGHTRTIYLGPQARSIVEQFLKTNPQYFLFAPADAERERREKAHAMRKTPLSCGNTPGRSKSPRKVPGERYTVESYHQAIRKACEKAFAMPEEYRPAPRRKGAVPDAPREADRKAELRSAWHASNSWHPNQLRHNAATRLRAEHGIDIAQTILGHRLGSGITEIYAEANVARAKQVMTIAG